MERSSPGITKKPTCPFCGMLIERPRELKTRRLQEMPVGSCFCGAVYAYDATGHNLGSAFIEALVFACNLDWDLAWGLLPEEDYLEGLVEKYDYETHLVIPHGFYQGRRVSGTLYFIRLHQDIQEVTHHGVQKRLEGSPVLPEPSGKWAEQKAFTKDEIEDLVKEYQVGSLLHLAGQDKRVIRDLQRLLYSVDELLRFRAAEILGRVSAVIAQKDPGSISKLLQRLFSSLSDPGASGWGAMDAIGEVIANSPEIFSGYIPNLFQFLEDRAIRSKVLRALGKVAEARPDLIQKSASYLRSLLRDPEPEVRGYAAWVLGNLGTSEARDDLERMQDEAEEISMYEDGQIGRRRIGQLAAEALQKI